MEVEGPPRKKKPSAQLEARRAAVRAEAAEREVRKATWISQGAARLYKEPHNIGGLLLPHLAARSVVSIILEYVVEANGSGKLRKMDGEEVPFIVSGYTSVNRLGYWASKQHWYPWLPVSVVLERTNVELPSVGDCAALIDVFTGRFPDLELRVGAGANEFEGRLASISVD